MGAVMATTSAALSGGKYSSKHMMEWSKPVIERLIQLGQERPCLWNTKHAEYHDRNKRTNVMEKLVTELKIPGKYIRQKNMM